MKWDKTVSVTGADLACRAEGPGAGAPWVVFSNSLVTNYGIWEPQAKALLNTYNVLRYDQRGHGQSTATTDPMNFTILGSDLLAVMDAAGMERGACVGLSMGVPTTLAAYEMAPERFTRLVFVDGMARTAPTGAATWAERIAFATENGMEALSRATAERWLQPDAPEEMVAALRAMVGAIPLEGFVQCARALQGYDYFAVSQALDLPVLAIAGANDGAMPDTMQRVFGALPRARMELVPEAGHVPNFERPDAFNALLRGFLDAHP